MEEKNPGAKALQEAAFANSIPCVCVAMRSAGVHEPGREKGTDDFWGPAVRAVHLMLLS